MKSAIVDRLGSLKWVPYRTESQFTDRANPTIDPEGKEEIEVNFKTMLTLAKLSLGKPKNQIPILSLYLCSLLLSVGQPFGSNSAIAQSITPANDGTGTLVTPNGDRFNIEGGKLSGDGNNLFHSLQEFNIQPGQIANFLTNPSIQNILTRIVGGNPSFINGLISVTGGNSNLFLMNPAGIVFGSNASLNVPADFTATTAAGIGFSSGLFSAFETNNYTALTGTPSTFLFQNLPPQLLINNGTLSVQPGNHVTLVAGAVINNEQVQAPNGTVNILSVPGSGVVRISQPGYLLNLEIAPVTEPIALLSTQLPEILTGGQQTNATDVKVNRGGQLALIAPNLGDRFNSNTPFIAAVRSTLPKGLDLKVGGFPLLADNLNNKVGFSGLLPPMPPILDTGIAQIPKLEAPVGQPLSLNNFGSKIQNSPLGLPAQLPLNGDFKQLPGEGFARLPGTGPEGDFLVRRFDPTAMRNFDPSKLSSMHPGTTALNSIAANLSSILTREQNLSTQFQDRLINAQVSPESIRETLSNITKLTENRSAIVYVTAFPDQLELILLTASGTPIRKTVPEATRDRVLAVAEQLREEITNPRKRNTTSYLKSAQQLYRWLVAPLEEALQENQIDTLLFSMDAGLRSTPLAVLHDGKQFLVEKYSFSLIPSLSLTDTRYQSLKNASILAMGASEFANLNPLPAVPTELSTIVGNLWPGKSFLNQEFTLNNLKGQRQQYPYQIIHLATHGEFNFQKSDNSYIQLWDTKLHLDRLRQLGWDDPPVELLVLSACRTGVGDDNNELGFAGLAFQAGVKSALASLWYVSDRGTLALMSEFYQHLKTVPVKAEALRQAQIAMIQGQLRIEAGTLRRAATASETTSRDIPLPLDPSDSPNSKLNHPYYWSAFMMVGSPW